MTSADVGLTVHVGLRPCALWAMGRFGDRETQENTNEDA
jgi:hypothetical protein